MKKWKTIVDRIHTEKWDVSDETSYLDKMSAKGWELVQAKDGYHGITAFYWKMPLSDYQELIGFND